MQKIPFLLLAIAVILIPMGAILIMSASSTVELVNGYVYISAGNLKDFVWYFPKDTHLTGKLSALPYAITFYVLDQENYLKFSDGQDFSGYGLDQVPTYDIDYRIPLSGRWHMILDNSYDNYNSKGIIALLKESYTSLLSVVSGILSLSSGILISVSAIYILRVGRLTISPK